MQVNLDHGVQPFQWHQDKKKWTTLSKDVGKDGQPLLHAPPIEATKAMYQFIQGKEEIKSLTIVDHTRRPIAFENLDDLL